MTQENQRLLNWLNNAKNQDKKNLEIEKKKMVNEIRGMKKEDLIRIPKKLTLWQKIKIMISGF